jgi:hypothetical protein
MSFEQLEFKELENNENIFKKEYFSYKIDELYREYQNLYYKTIFENHSFRIEKDKSIIVPLTFDMSEKNYSFFGDPIEFFYSKKIKKINYEKIKKKFNDSKHKSLFKFEIKSEKPFVKNKFNFIDKIINEIYIDLSLSIEDIKSNFSSNHRNEISKNYSNTVFKIIDYKNYKPNMIFEMMDLHKKVSGRQTRSKESWIQNEKMILEKKGFLTKVELDEKVISYSFFYHNKYTCIYLSSVGLREYYKIVRNMHHKSLWLAINYAKKYCKYFYIGPITLFNKISITEKEKSIEKFKNKFKGINKKFIILNKLPDYEQFNEIINLNDN